MSLRISAAVVDSKVFMVGISRVSASAVSSRLPRRESLISNCLNFGMEEVTNSGAQLIQGFMQGVAQSS